MGHHFQATGKYYRYVADDGKVEKKQPFDGDGAKGHDVVLFCPVKKKFLLTFYAF